MADRTTEDRAWVEAVEEYAKRARTRRRLPLVQGRWILAGAVALALLAAPLAGAAGGVLGLGKRNPGSGTTHGETQIISSSKTYGTRQSNTRKGNGGGAIYGCRSKPGREPCIRSNNLSNGRAFEFETDGAEGGRINANLAGARPFSTNATGVATGLNADRVDSMDAARIDFRAAVGTASTEVLNLDGLVLRASCGAGNDLDVRADTTVPHSVLHVSWSRDPGNMSFYRQSNDLNGGANFAVMSTGNDDAAEGTISYSSPSGHQVSVTFQSSEGSAFGNTVACLFAGTAQGFSP